MTKNELIVDGCRSMAFQDLRDTLSAALDDRDATIAELREDRRVLGAEVRSWRYQCVQENTEGGDVDGATCMVNAAMEATDSSKALERANG